MKTIAPTLLSLSLILSPAALTQSLTIKQPPLGTINATNLGTITPPNGQTLQPTALYEPNDTNAQFKVWWLSNDEIWYMKRGPGGWSKPILVLDSLFGRGGYDRVDDHKVGSPSVVKVYDTYYMFYECMHHATPLARFYSASRNDHWTSNWAVKHTQSKAFCTAGYYNDNHASYAKDKVIGWAPTFQRRGTRPIYGGEKRYRHAGNKLNRYLSTIPVVNTCNVGGEDTRPLGFGDVLFWLYTSDAPGRVPVYQNWNASTLNTSEDSVPGHNAILLGYAASNPSTGGLRGANQNHLCLATSKDGKNWTRFDGPATGGAILAPAKLVPPKWNWNTLVMDENYGAGYPSALFRGDKLEVTYLDTSAKTTMIRMPVGSILDASAYAYYGAPSRRHTAAFIASDIVWSPMQQRYLYASRYLPNAVCMNNPSYRESPCLAWSSKNASMPDIFGTMRSLLPTNTSNGNTGRFGTWGGFASTAAGHAVEAYGPNANSALHIIYSAANHTDYKRCPLSIAEEIAPLRLDHLLTFIFPSTQPKTPDLVGHWPLAEGQGIVASDLATFGNYGSIRGKVQWGKRGSQAAIKFIDPSNKVMIADSDSLDLSNRFTIAAWVRPTKIATQLIVSKHRYGFVNGYELGLSKQGIFYVRCNQKTSKSQFLLFGKRHYPTNGSTWIHVAATYDGSRLKLFVNGIEDSSMAASFSIPNNNLPLAIGAEAHSGNNNFIGAVSDVRLLNRAMKPKELCALGHGSNCITASSTVFGSGCPRGNGKQPTISIDPPRLGTNVNISLGAGVPSSPTACGIATSRGNRNFLNTSCIWYPDFLISAFGATDTKGSAKIPVLIPNDVNLMGVRFYAQFFQQDPSSSRGLTTTRGLSFHVGY